MQMPGRKFNGGDYRYGFNGKENDNEIKGEGNSIDFGARMYDSRLGRFFAVDPKASDYPFMSPYCYAANSPILFIDENGEGPVDGILRLIARSIEGTASLEVVGSVSVGYLVTASHGLAVDQDGNVALLNVTGQGVESDLGGLSLGSKLSFLYAAENVTHVKGVAETMAFDITIPGSPIDVGVSHEKFVDGKTMGISAQASLSTPGPNPLPLTVGYEYSVTTLVAMTGSEYDQIIDGRWTDAYKQAREWNSIIKENGGGGIWEIISAGISYVKIPGSQNQYEAVINNVYSFKTVSQTADGVSLNPVNYTENINTGVYFTGDSQGNMISNSMQEKTN